MKSLRPLFLIAGLSLWSGAIQAQESMRLGAAAYGGWQDDAPGVTRKITPTDLPAPHASSSANSEPSLAARPANAAPRVPAGFTATLFASGLKMPRALRVAPNGDLFVAESQGGRIHVFRPGNGPGQPTKDDVFATGLDRPYGMAFYPPGPDPSWLYVGEAGKVVRLPYHSGDLTTGGPGETVVPSLPANGGHWTRDIAFAPDGSQLYVGVGSSSNNDAGMPRLNPAAIRQFESSHAPGSAWGAEENRADVLKFDPDGGHPGIFATGIRNCAGLAVQPTSGELWCATNERDTLGDNLPPDYVTHVMEGAFYGWPWFFIGDHEDPSHKGERPDLAGSVTVPDVLIQPHSAPLGIAFYQGGQFPAEYRGDAFVTLHGSWNRGLRTGYKVVRLLFKDGKPTGAYQDFMTGFVVSDNEVWGRPVGVAVGKDGALYVSEDGNDTIWRIGYRGR